MEPESFTLLYAISLLWVIFVSQLAKKGEK
jgi:hypothetical protein